MPSSPAPENPTPIELPLFPLGTVLFPGALLPLQLFELRYLQMIGECYCSMVDLFFWRTVGILGLNCGR
jgi:Lon protease-like protein